MLKNKLKLVILSFIIPMLLISLKTQAYLMGGDFPFPLSGEDDYALINVWEILGTEQVVTAYQEANENKPWMLFIQNRADRKVLAGITLTPNSHIQSLIIWDNVNCYLDLNLAKESAGYLEKGEVRYLLKPLVDE